LHGKTTAINFETEIRDSHMAAEIAWGKQQT